MKGWSKSNGMLIACLTIVALAYPVVGEVAKLTIDTDTTWKCINFEQPGWTAVDYDDSWWESAVNEWQNLIETADEIWYPGRIVVETAYFRRSFEIDGGEILIAELYTGLDSSGGTIELYVNDQQVGEVTSTENDPTRFDITSMITPGTNVIAAKVTRGDSANYPGWALTATIRYDKY